MSGFIPESLRAFRNSRPEAKIDVLVVGGTWHPNGDGITETFSTALDPDRYRVRVVPYPADYGGRVTYADSTFAGRAALAAAMAERTGPVILAGYSQGAAVAGDVARASDPAAVLACALVADPLRPLGRHIGADPGGYGIAGQREIPGIPTFWSAAHGDPITALPAGNPLRTVADLSAYFSLTGPEAALRWGRDMFEVALSGRMQRWWSPAHRREWGGAVAYARGYLLDGRHTEDYVRLGHARRLAEELDAWVRGRATAR